jgi:ABC-type ATPase involved in cell division
VVPSDGDVEEAARAAEVHAFIAARPRGYDTDVGKGGERQRIAVARAIVRAPRADSRRSDVGARRAYQITRAGYCVMSGSGVRIVIPCTIA